MDTITPAPRARPRTQLRSPQGHLLIGLSTIGVALFFLYQGRDYELGTLERPGPGAFPLGICIGLLAVGALIVVTSLLGRGDDDGEDADAGGNNRTLLLMLVLIGYVIGLNTIGFTVSGLVAAFLMVHLLGTRLGLVGRVLYVGGLVLGTELLFSFVFGILFPGGLVGVIFG